MLETDIQLNNFTIADIQVGQKTKLDFVVTDEDVQTFAKLTGDYSPLHMDEQFARRTRYRRRVAHGMLIWSITSALVGMCLPGCNATLLGQETKFLKPVNIGDKLTVLGEVITKSLVTSTITIAVTILNRDNNENVLKGQVKVLVNVPAKKGVNMDEIKELDTGIDFTNQVVLITGASRGFGAATAKLFANRGARVMINYFRGESDAQSIVDEILSFGGEAHAIQADVRNEQEVKVMIQECITQYGQIDVLVNNAVSDIAPKEFKKLGWEDMQQDIDVIIKGAFYCMQEALPLMVARNTGKVINVITSWAVGAPPLRWSSYISAKAALLGLTRCLAVEYAPYNIKVNAVSPGFADTDLNIGIPEPIKAKMANEIPLQRHAAPIDVAKAIVFMASDYADYITGQQLIISGGSIML